MRQTPGNLLKTTREEKRITIQQAAEDTHITSRHLVALEADNFGVFPGETYTTGFLRSYSTYLELDPEVVLQLYRGAQISEKESPLQELTRPTLQASDYIQKYSKLLFALFVLALVGTGIGIFLNTRSSTENVNIQGSNGENDPGNIENFLRNSSNIPEVETEHVKLRAGFTTAVIPVGKGIDFSVANTEVYIVLKELGYRAEENERSNAKIEFYPGKRIIALKENQPVEVKENGVANTLRITLIGATPNNAKVQIEKVGEAQQTETVNVTPENTTEPGTDEVRIANPSNFIIRLEGSTVSENYVEFFIDGKPGKRGQLAPGSQFYYEANDSIQMKIGDAGAVSLRINGKPEVLGRKGQTVNKIIRKERDPVEQTKFRVVVKDG